MPRVSLEPAGFVFNHAVPKGASCERGMFSEASASFHLNYQLRWDCLRKAAKEIDFTDMSLFVITNMRFFSSLYFDFDIMTLL